MYDIVFDIVFDKIKAKNIAIQSSLLNPTQYTIRETMICNLMHVSESKFIQLRNENRNANEVLICFIYAEFTDYKEALLNLYQFKKSISEISILEKNNDFNENVFLEKGISPPNKIILLIQNTTSEMMCEYNKTYNPTLFPALVLHVQIIID